MVIGVLGCHHADPPIVVPPVVLARSVPAPTYIPPVLQPAPPWHLACTVPANRPQASWYEFASIPFAPNLHLPRVAERGHVGHPRSLHQLDRLLQPRVRAIAGCWKWAASRGAAPATGTITFEIDPDGYATDTAVTLRPQPMPELARCIAEQLDGAEVAHSSARPTRVTLPLVLVLAAQRPWPTPPPRPAAPAPPTRAPRCAAILDDGSHDRLDSPLPLELSDFDTARERGLIVDDFGCATVSHAPSKQAMRTALQANGGALAACYARALDGGMPASGTVTVAIDFWNGVPVATRAEGAGDEAFHTCLATAARETSLDGTPRGRWITARYPLDLEPAAAPITGDAEAHLTGDDPGGAIAAWTAELARPLGPAAGCTVRANLVRAYAALAPWLDDDRVRGAISDLVRAAAALPPTAGTACLATAASVLEAFALPTTIPSDWLWLDRTEPLMPVVALLPFGERLRRFHAEQLVLTPRRAEGIAMLRALEATQPTDVLREPLTIELRLTERAILGGCGMP